ncbi:ALA-interacting subunit 1-like isoform X2 [Andrographis paniculata]|uniref:ALA-interacting subunit 1-like isoform X2 n=1 Tax=Andrographis paniculata TaxID=175694 RepID=UPI0021E95E19|nr:ALA-interacting subunit 1-like isoform X2 [Andrographis paniculata]
MMDSVDLPSSVDESGSLDPTSDTRKFKQPKHSKFKQQELSSCKPIITPKLVVSTLLFICAVFIPIGFLSLSASRNVVEIVHQYETECVPIESRNDISRFMQSSSNKTCSRTLNVPKHMKQPIYVYYQLDNFHQNHRRYMKSRSDKQLMSRASEGDTQKCWPEDVTKDGMPILPCGLIAWSVFNDTYRFSRNKKPLTLNRRDITWKRDRERKFGNNVYPKNFQRGALIGGGRLNESKPVVRIAFKCCENLHRGRVFFASQLSEQEDLIVWMRTAALSNFRKLYGKIEEDLVAGDTVDVILENNYNAYIFDGKKKLVLSTETWLGGKNEFLGFVYLGVGGLCFVLGMVFAVIFVVVKPRKLGDTSRFSWHNDAGYN